MVVERSISDCTERAKWTLQKIATTRWIRVLEADFDCKKLVSQLNRLPLPRNSCEIAWNVQISYCRPSVRQPQDLVVGISRPEDLLSPIFLEFPETQKIITKDLQVQAVTTPFLTVFGL